MIIASVNLEWLTLSGEAARDSGSYRVKVTHTRWTQEIENNDAVGTFIPVPGYTSALATIDVRGVTNAGVYVYNGYQGDWKTLGSHQNDYLSAYSTGDGVVRGFGGNDNISGSLGADILRGNDGDDTINGNEGNDTISGGWGNDLIDGGDGSDTLVFSGIRAAYDLSVVEGVYKVNHARGSQKDGTDTFDNVEFLQFADETVAISSIPTNLTAQISGSQLTLSGEAARDSAGYRVKVTNTRWTQEIEDNDAVGTFIPVPGYTSALATIDVRGVTNAGVYVYNGYQGDWKTLGSHQNDYLSAYSTGDGVVRGFGGNDNISGSLGADILRGNDGDDTINGNEGNDTISGGWGNDLIDGGDGSDTIVFSDIRAAYDLSIVEGVYKITHANGSQKDGTDTFANVEFLQFADETVAVDDVFLI